MREEAGFEDIAVEDFAVEEATPLVEEKEFVAAEVEATASAEVVKNAMEEVKAINIKGEVVVEVEDEDISSSLEREEARFEETAVEECTVEETGLVEKKEFVAVEVEAAASAEVVESAMQEVKAIDVEAEVESEPATVSEEAGVDVASTIEEAHKDALLSEASAVLEEKAVAEVEDEDMSSSLVREEAGFEDIAVEDSAVEEAIPLVEEKEFVAPEVETVASAEVVESRMEEAKAVELEAEVESEPATVAEEVGVDVATTIEEAHEEALLSKESPVVEKAVAEVQEEDIATSHVQEEAAFQESVVEETDLQKIADGYVEEFLVVGEYGIGLTGVVDDYFPGNFVRLRKNSEEASVDVHSWVPEFVGALSVPIVSENGPQVGSLVGNDIKLSGVTGFSPVIELHGTKKKSDEVSVDVNLEICEDDGGARQNPISGISGFVSEVDGFDLGHIGYSGADLFERISLEPFERIKGKGVDIDNMSTMRAAKDKEAVIHGCAKDSMEGSEWKLVAPQLVEIPNNTGNAIKARQDNEENVHLTKESPNHGIEEKSALATEWEFVAEELEDTHVQSEGPGLQSSPFERVKESIESSDWEMVPTGSGAKDENFAEYIEMTKESAEIPTTEEDEIADMPIGGERVLNNTSEEKEPTSTRGLDQEIPLIKVVQNKDQETEDVTVDVGVSEIESPLENLQEENEFSIKSPFNVEHFKKRPLGVGTRKLKHVSQEPKVKVHKAVLPTWPPSPITSEEDNTRVDIDHEIAPVVESRQIPSVVDVEIIEEPSVATTGENMEVSEDPHTPKKDEQEETNLSS